MSRSAEPLRRVLAAWIATGLTFMLLPGTILGVWNLLGISAVRGPGGIPAAWIQAHGHAQVFGWTGSFVLGIGFYSLSRMRGSAAPPVRRAWTSWALWTAGVALRWSAGVYGVHWRVLVPAGAALELTAFCLFFATVSRHGSGGVLPFWVRVVAASTCGFFVTLAVNFAAAVWMALSGSGPALPHGADQRILALPLWTFVLPAIWGFNARWLPQYGGLRPVRERALTAALALAWGTAVSALANLAQVSGWFAITAAITAALALRVFEPADQQTGTPFRAFIRAAYTWLAVGSGLSLWAAYADRAGGIWGASRHSLTVGFISAMVFSVGQAILPELAGMPAIFSRRLMLASVILLNAGCALRVSAEPPAYEWQARAAWHVLPCSALVEMAAFTLFAANLALTFSRLASRVRAVPSTPTAVR